MRKDKVCDAHSMINDAASPIPLPDGADSVIFCRRSIRYRNGPVPTV